MGFLRKEWQQYTLQGTRHSKKIGSKSAVCVSEGMQCYVGGVKAL